MRSLWDGLLGFALSHRYVPSLVSALRVHIPNACVFQTLYHCPVSLAGCLLFRQPLIVLISRRRFKSSSALLVKCRVACFAHLTSVLDGLTSFGARADDDDGLQLTRLYPPRDRALETKEGLSPCLVFWRSLTQTTGYSFGFGVVGMLKKDQIYLHRTDQKYLHKQFTLI